MSTREHSKRLYPGGKERGKARATILDSDDSDSADEPGGDAKMGDLGSDDDENALEGLGQLLETVDMVRARRSR